MNPFSWEDHRYKNSVACKISPRETWRGNPIRPLVIPYIGYTVRVTVAWKMDPDDPYPGEYALVPADDESDKIFRAMDITWMASGDVIPNPGDK